MPEQYIKAEIVRPKRPMPEHVAEVIGGLITLALKVLAVWWFFAAWYAEFGLTYWQLVLPVWVVLFVTSRKPLGRNL